MFFSKIAKSSRHRKVVIEVCSICLLFDLKSLECTGQRQIRFDQIEQLNKLHGVVAISDYVCIYQGYSSLLKGWQCIIQSRQNCVEHKHIRINEQLPKYICLNIWIMNIDSPKQIIKVRMFSFATWNARFRLH